MKHILTLVLLCICLFSCTNDDNEDSQTVNLKVNHYRNTGVGEGQYLTLLIQEEEAIGSSEWSRLYSPIEDFNYVPGKIYDLTVEKMKVKNPPADGSSIRYKLISINNTEDVDADTTFEIDLKSNGNNFVRLDSGFSILNEIEMDCNLLCDEMTQKLEAQDRVIGDFKHVFPNGIVLLAIN